MKIVIMENGKAREQSFSLETFVEEWVNADKGKTSDKEIVEKVLACLQAHKKRCGSFVLLEVEELGGKVVKIII